MDAPKFENLDLACAQAGRAIAPEPSKDLAKVITSALAVLEEQGVYALFLFLQAHKNKKMAESVRNSLHKFLKETPQQAPLFPDLDPNPDADKDKIFTRLQKMAEDLDRWLLARDLLRQVLVYARYHALEREEESEAAA